MEETSVPQPPDGTRSGRGRDRCAPQPAGRLGRRFTTGVAHLRRQGEVNPLVISGRHRFIADYLGEDVLGHLPEETRRFLLQTSILDRLCGSARRCPVRTSGGQEMLEFLERENLFLVPLDASREVSVTGSSATSCALNFTAITRIRFDLHRRAARWYLAHDLPEEAFHHAVVETTSTRGPHLRPLCEREASGRRVPVLQHWLDSPPGDVVRRLPRSTSLGPVSWPSPARSKPACAVSMTSNRGWRTRTVTTRAGSWQR